MPPIKNHFIAIWDCMMKCPFYRHNLLTMENVEPMYTNFHKSVGKIISQDS